MNEVTYTMTSEDWADYFEWVNVDRYSAEEFSKLCWNGHRNLIGFLAVSVFVVSLAQFFLGMTLLLISLGVLAYSFANYKNRRRAACRQKGQTIANAERRTVQLQSRGILETLDGEECLTLWDAIVSVETTPKTLLSKDKRGNALTIPFHAFGSESAMKAFALEIENRRMRHAVGLAPATPILSQSTNPVTTPTVPQEAPQQQATAGWWRKPQ